MQFRIEEKLSLTLFLSICAFSFSSEIHFALLLLLALLRLTVPSMQSLSPKGNKRLWKFVLYFTLLSTAMVFVNGALVHEGPVAFRLVSVEFFRGGLLFGLETGSRLLVLVVTLLILFHSTTLKEIAVFFHRIGLPDQAVMAFLLTFHWMDQLPSKLQRIFTSQEARGAPVRSTAVRRVQAFFAILTPLVLSSIVESIDRGMALELRGFHSRSTLASLQEHTAPRSITPLTTILLLLSLATLVWNILNRLFP